MARGTGRKDRAPGTFGSVDKLATGYRARYFGPDGRRHKAPVLFLTKTDARAWLAQRHSEIVAQQWTPPQAIEVHKTTFTEYADQWLLTRQVAGRPLKDRTREHYQALLDDHITATFGALPLASITADDVRQWYARTLTDKPTMRSHAYGLLRTILATAVSDGKISVNPCSIRGAGTAKRVHKVRPATVGEIGTIADAMPAQWSLMVLLAAWLAMRFGELTELRRKDIDLSAEVVRVRRAVVRTDDGFKVTSPKSDAGIRDIAIPPHLIPAIEAHLSKHVGSKPDSLLFPAVGGAHLAPATLYRRFYAARAKAKRDDLRWHDLRHSGAVLAAATGATLAELMARLGHSTPQAAMRYQHAAQGRDRQIAKLLSAIAQADTPTT
ncbi:tyrosine-type recombinase/integrase [Mycolicibacterium gilvum]|uniref:tyrosine-type recombinase/integrase n=1 Tax=Mycolicibacterium gilvum TaxID=1804 RepID=UPI00404624AC